MNDSRKQDAEGCNQSDKPKNRASQSEHQMSPGKASESTPPP